MLKWLRKREINALKVQIAHDEAYHAALHECNEVDPYVVGRLAANRVRLRQLEPIMEVVRTGLPENYLKKMLDEANKIAGEKENG